MNQNLPIEISLHKVRDFCLKWKIKEFALFGSILRDDFNPIESDIDILVSFINGNNISLFDMIEMKEELENLYQRKVDIVNKESIEKSKNPYRKKEILENFKVIYDEAA
jgi:predicted nucleotidyltransferase